MEAADRARARLVDGLRAGGRIRAAAVEAAFREVPRHLFLPGIPLGRAYADEAVAVQTVDGVTTSSASQPSMMAIMLGQLDLRRGHRVLEIGAGTGYNAALLRHVVGPAGRVVAVDIDAGLVDGAARHLADAGVDDVTLVCGDGAVGHAPDAPYDRIVLTVGSDDVRPEWVAQLAPDGRLLLPLTVRGFQISVALDLGPDGVLRSDSASGCAFVRLRGAGAATERRTTRCGLWVLPADDHGTDGADPDAVGAALAAPAGRRPAPVRLRAGEVGDGFGLWLGLTEPGACRLVAAPHDDHDHDPGGVVGLLRLGPGRATAGLVRTTAARGPGAPADADAVGLAAVVLDRPDDVGPAHPRSVHLQVFGPAADAAADRMRTALTAWQAAGRPTASDLRFTVVPRGVAPPPSAPGTAVVEKEHCRVLVDTRPRAGRASG